MGKIDRFIENYPNQLAREFHLLLGAFNSRDISRGDVKKLMAEKVMIALNTIRPRRIKRRHIETLSEKIMRGRTQGYELRNKRIGEG